MPALSALFTAERSYVAYHAPGAVPRSGARGQVMRTTQSSSTAWEGYGMRRRRMKRPDTPLPQGGGSHGTPGDPRFKEDYPTLWEMLTCVRWEDGAARETSTLMVFVEGSMWKVQLRDRALQRALWRSGDSLDDCLIEIEGAVSQQSCGDWRPFQAQPGTKRRR